MLGLVITQSIVAQGKYFDSNGVNIHYIDQGAGVPIVLVHGRGGSLQGWIANGVLPNLTKDYRVVAFDLRGHGLSAKPHTQQQYGKEMALDIVRLMDHLGIEKAHIIGYSLGANIVAQLLILHPERFITATLGGSAGRFRWTTNDDEIVEREASETERLGFSPSFDTRIAPPNTAKATDEEIKKRSAVALVNPAEDRFAMAAIIRSSRDQLISAEEVAAVKVPTLGIVGSKDSFILSLQDLKQQRPGLQLVIVENGTHSGEEDTRKRPEFIAAIRQFIASNSKAPLK
ncbi:MAG: acoC [Mucilaginibacter sp.]|nr:acoC [Mucilaginibacter sp.]